MGRVSAQPSSSGGEPIASAVSDLPGGRPHLRRSLPASLSRGRGCGGGATRVLPVAAEAATSAVTVVW